MTQEEVERQLAELAAMYGSEPPEIATSVGSAQAGPE